MPSNPPLYSTLCIYVGTSPNSVRNLQWGLESETWGFPEDLPAYRTLGAAYIVIGTRHSNGGPRTPSAVWKQGTLDVYICVALNDFYDAHAPHWDDEFAKRRVLYPRRIGMVPIGLAREVPVSEIDENVAEALRRSGAHAGHGKRVQASLRTLFERAGLPLEAPSALNLGRTSSPVLDEEHSSRRARGAGYVQDVKRRKATELYAEKIAEQQLTAAGYTFLEKRGAPFDLLFRDPEGELVRVEVKGTTSAGASVSVTEGEVLCHHQHENGILIVVSDITYTVDSEDGRCSGGVARIIRKWRPEREHLQPKEYRYVVPWGQIEHEVIKLPDAA